MNSIAVSGSPVLDLLIGQTYGRADRPGVYTLVQFETADEVLVKEYPTGALHKVETRYLTSLVSALHARDRDLLVENDERTRTAKRNMDAIQPLLAYRRVPNDVLQARATEVGLAPKTLLKWLRRFRADPRLSSLQRKRRTDINESRFDPLVERCITGAVKRLTKDGNLLLKDAHNDLVEEVKELAKKHAWTNYRVPSYGTLYARYRLLSQKTIAEGRLGKRPARLLHGLQKGSILDIDHPLAIVQVDHLEVPVIIVDAEERIPIGKAWITVLIDLFSRCVVGYYITLESPGNLSLGMAMVHAILPKEEMLNRLGFKAKWPISGFMWAVHADNAGEFHGNMLELAAGEYVIDLMFRKVREPNYGGHIESYLGTLSEQLRRVPGSTREGPEALGETDPSENASLTLDELERYIVSLIIEYHNTAHTGLHGMTPLGRFADGMRGGPSIIPVGRLRRAMDPERLRIDFLPCDERVVTPKGIRWSHVDYMDGCLQRWVNAEDPKRKGQKRFFLVRRDPRDISTIYFLDPEENCYRVIGTKNITRPMMTLWELNAIRKFLKERGIEHIDEDVIFAARAERRAIEAAAIVKTRAAKRRRARDRERERRSRDGIAAPAPQIKPEPAEPPGSPPAASTQEPVTPFTMDWGDT